MSQPYSRGPLASSSCHEANTFFLPAATTAQPASVFLPRPAGKHLEHRAQRETIYQVQERRFPRYLRQPVLGHSLLDWVSSSQSFCPPTLPSSCVLVDENGSLIPSNNIYNFLKVSSTKGKASFGDILSNDELPGIHEIIFICSSSFRDLGIAPWRLRPAGPTYKQDLYKHLPVSVLHQRGPFHVARSKAKIIFIT